MYIGFVFALFYFLECLMAIFPHVCSLFLFAKLALRYPNPFIILLV